MKKTSKKSTKKATKVAKTASKSTKKVVKAAQVKPSLITALPEIPVSMTTQMAFDDVYFVFDALYTAFHHNPGPNHTGDVDERFLSFWTLFLITAGWTEEEFWEELDNSEHTCEECRKEQADTKGKTSETEEEFVLEETKHSSKLMN